MFFCFLHAVGFWSIFTFILSFRKNKYQIYSYSTSTMDDFKTICIYRNILVFAYLLKNVRVYLVSLKNLTFWNIFLRAKHVLNTFKLWMLCARLYLFVVYISYAPVISASIHRYMNYSYIYIYIYSWIYIYAILQVKHCQCNYWST